MHDSSYADIVVYHSVVFEMYVEIMHVNVSLFTIQITQAVYLLSRIIELFHYYSPHSLLIFILFSLRMIRVQHLNI